MMQSMLSWALRPSKVFSLFASENVFTLSSSYVLSGKNLSVGKLLDLVP
jgi:hypothetical protein